MTNFPDVNNTEEALKFLSSAEGVSSTENLFCDIIKPYLDSVCDNTDIDKNGNITGFIKADTPDAKTLMFEAHMDRIGLMITDIRENGCLLFTNIGGVDERILPYAEVTVCGKEKLTGIIYPYKYDDEKLDIKSFQIDTGHKKEDIEKLVSIGDVVLLSSDFVKLCGKTVSGAAFDNRAGIASVLQAISNIDRSKLKYNICVMFSVEEEVGLHGAFTSDYEPDAVIVIDVTHGETRDTKGEVGVFPLGCGAVICRGPSLDYDYTNQLISLCKDNDIPYDIEIATGSSGTTAWAFQTQSCGIPSILVSIPLKYMHTNLETLDLDDIESVSRLLSISAEGGLKL